MKVRRTSLVAYQEITENGMLKGQQATVYNALFKHGPLTAQQVQEMCFPKNGVQAWRRLPELRRMGVAQEVGEAVHPESGRPTILWDVTENLPDRTKEQANRKADSAERVITRLEVEVADLRVQLEKAQAEITLLKTPGAQLTLF